MEPDAGLPQERSRRAQTQQDMSDLPRSRHRQRPKSVHDMSAAFEDLRSAPRQAAANREQQQRPARSSSRRRQATSQRDRDRDRDRDVVAPPAGPRHDSRGLQDFLRQFHAIDLAHAAERWVSDKQRVARLEASLEAIQANLHSFLSHFCDINNNNSSGGAPPRNMSLHEASLLWADERKKLAEADARFQALQNEVLSTVDRFQPTYDERITKGFGMLQAVIGGLVNQSLTKSVKLDRWDKWADGVLWDGAVNGSLFGVGRDKETEKGKGKGEGEDGRLPKREERLLVRQAVWKFLAEALFDRAHPFTSFAGLPAAEGFVTGGKWVFDVLFPDHG